MSVSSGSRMYCCVFIAVSLATLKAVQTNDVQQQNAKKTVADPTKAPPSLDEMLKLLTKLEERISQIESKRAILLRGRDGRDGQPGIPGKDGLSGKDGRDGKDGKDGKDGWNGKDGSPGPIGSKGETGRPGVGVKGPPGPKSGGVQYVRWGKTTCPLNGTLVYKGSVGGSFYSHKGGAANYVCLPETPKYGKFRAGVHGSRGYMYGTEYQDANSKLFTNTNLEHHDVPCAVCYVKTRNVKLMIPATYACPAGWIREYHGYLMSENYDHAHPTEYICVDIDSEALPGTKVDVDGALLYHVEGRCGSLPCSPYAEGRELTCAVCTK